MIPLLRGTISRLFAAANSHFWDCGTENVKVLLPGICQTTTHVLRLADKRLSGEELPVSSAKRSKKFFFSDKKFCYFLVKMCGLA